jgi:ABC-type uncharacterized transport system substrate-binding protein
VLAPSAASAHPHVWVAAETEVLYQNNTIVGLRQKWTFDEFYTTMAIQGLDANNDGIYDRGELAELAKVNVDGLKDFQFFTHARLAAQALEFAEPTDYHLEHAETQNAPGPAGDPAPAAPPKDASFWSRLKDSVTGKSAAAPEKAKVLSLHFTLPLKQPVLADAEGFSYAIYDSSFFIWFDLDGARGAKLGAGAPKACKAEVSAGDKDGRDLQKLGEAFFSQLGGTSVGAGVAKTVSVTCPRT